MKIYVAGFQHETNTFAPSLADWAAFNRGDSFPAFIKGQAMLDSLRGVNIPIGGFMDAARREGWQLVPGSWCGAIPSSYVTRDAFERVYFEYHLGRENNSMTRVSEKTGLERTHLYRKLKQLGIESRKRTT